MHYQRLHPPGYLRDYIQYFWTLTSNVSSPLPQAFGPLADGCPGLIFQPSEKGVFFDQYNKQLPEVFLYGQTVTRTALYLKGQFKALGVCFYPNTLKSVFGFKASELTDSCLNINLIAARNSVQLPEQLINAISTEEQIDILSDYLFSLVKKNKGSVDSPTRFAVSQIIQSKGSISLQGLQQDFKLSERSFERRFEQHVGVSPKLFSRICRFQAALNQLKTNRYAKLSDIAFDNGYADQSHFIRTFKEFTGFSPFDFQKQSHPIVDNFPVLIKE
jgi:AraC-like DNA-binding protein